MTQVVGFPTPTWETWTELSAPNFVFGLALRDHGNLGGELADTIFLSPSPPFPSLPFYSPSHKESKCGVTIGLTALYQRIKLSATNDKIRYHMPPHCL